MLTDTILRYLESNRRLVIPQLGAFVVKEPGVSVLFSELLRRDDGVLRSLLCKEGMTELEAAGAVDRFVFEVRHAVQEGRRYPMAGFGELYAAADGAIHFDYAPQQGVRPLAGEPQSRPATDGTEAASLQPGGGERPTESESGHRPRPAYGGGYAAAHSRHEEPAAPAHKPTHEASLPEPDDSLSGEVLHSTERAGREASSGHRAQVRGGVHDVADEPKISVSKLRSDPSVKGLRYGKPVKTTDAYTYVGATPRRRFDRLIIVAIAAAVIALAAITYGYIRGRQAARADAWAEEWVDESMLPAEGGVEEMQDASQHVENEETRNP